MFLRLEIIFLGPSQINIRTEMLVNLKIFLLHFSEIKIATYWLVDFENVNQS